MNYLMITIGVVVAALAHWFLGALWYSPLLFGKKWMELGKIQVNPEKMKSSMFWGLVIDIVMAAVMACLMYRFAITDIKTAVWFAAQIWLGFVATITAYSIVYDNKPTELYLLNNGYNLLGMIVTAVTLTFFIGA